MPDLREELRADCARCAGLCCTVPGFARSADFAFDKPARQPCPHLRTDFGCAVHARLRDLGMPGCTVYDCFGAGQHVVQATFEGRDWRSDPTLAGAMFAAFEVVRDLHELLWLLTEARALLADTEDGLAEAVTALHARVDVLRGSAAADLPTVDVGALRAETGDLLRRTSARVRAGHERARPGGDLVGRRLRGTDLRGCDLRGALLLGADLREADLRRADLLGADLRGADLRAADLSTSLFLTGPQVAAARGDQHTRLPATLPRPGHWRTEVPDARG